jgi:hypothetical protein
MLRGDVRLYLHPLAGFVAIAVAAWAASLGLRSRTARPDAGRARVLHRRVAPCAWALVVLNWIGGLAVVWALQPELERGTSGHFTVGTAIVGLLSAGALLSRRVPTDPRARAVHPWLGAAALLLSGVQVFLGLQLLP